jgi:hypothetical protein
MTHPGELQFTVSGTELIKLEEFAQHAGVPEQDFVLQGLVLGLDLAELAIESRPYKAHIAFEETRGSARFYEVDFGQLKMPEPDISMVDFELALMSLDEDESRLLVTVDPDTSAEILKYARYFDGDPTDFASSASFYRHKWAVARRHSGRVLFDNGTRQGIVLDSPQMHKPGGMEIEDDNEDDDNHVYGDVTGLL